MLNKEEIQYNTNGLVSAWLNKYGKTTRLVIELSNDESENEVECSESDCGNKIGELLFDNCEKYKKLTLFDITDKKNFVGEIDIE